MKESSSQSNHSENTTMNEILIAFSQKYNGHFLEFLKHYMKMKSLQMKN